MEDSWKQGKAKLRCPKCEQVQLARIARRGFLRERFLPLLGLFPWQCAICGEELLIRNRGRVDRNYKERKRATVSQKVPGTLHPQ
jgi:hypothetical protein